MLIDNLIDKCKQRNDKHFEEYKVRKTILAPPLTFCKLKINTPCSMVILSIYISQSLHLEKCEINLENNDLLLEDLSCKQAMVETKRILDNLKFKKDKLPAGICFGDVSIAGECKVEMSFIATKK